SREIVDPQRPRCGLVSFRGSRRGSRLGRLHATKRCEKMRHRLIGSRGEKKVDWRQHLVIHAPAVMNQEISAHADNLGLWRFRAKRWPQATAEIDPVKRENKIGVFARLIRSR